jgi:hypothetical protein
MYDPPLPKGLSCTIKQRRTPSKLKAEQDATAPAPHDYDVVKALAKLNKEPCYSFGKVMIAKILAKDIRASWSVCSDC